MTDTPTFTIDQVLAIYLKAKDDADALGKRHAEEMKPLTTRLEVAKSWMMDYLNREGLENAKTKDGQCFKSHIMSATVDPEGGWEKLLGHIFRSGMARVLDAIEKGQDEFAAMDEFMKAPELALFVRNVNKTAVKDMLDQKVEVPGVKIATVTQLNVRRA